MVPKDIHILMPGTWGYHLTWQNGLCGRDEVKDFERQRLSQIALNILTGILIRERSDTGTKQEKTM